MAGIGVPENGTRIRAWVLAVVAPLLIALVFPHPTERIVVPESLMLLVVLATTLLGGREPGIVSALWGTVLLWYFNLEPGYSLRLAEPTDGIAIAASLVTAVVVAMVADMQRTRRERAAQQSAEALAEVEAQRRVIDAMQRALLPHAVPPTQGITVGWHYRPGGRAAGPVGGDWVAFVPVGPSALGIGIGDVVGHGLDAVAAMAQLRFALRALAAAACSPSETLERLAAVVHAFPPVTVSSCFYGVLDGERRTWTFANAGHPPPLLVRGGAVDVLDLDHGTLLGVHGDGDLPQNTVRLQPEDVLVLYTDGLVERRRESIDDGIDRLRDWCGANAHDSDLRMLSTAVADDLAGTVPDDDVAVVFARLDASPARAG